MVPIRRLYFITIKLGLLSAEDLKPFDSEHSGTILAEGASALILESEEAAQQRGAHCYAEILGGGSGTEGKGLFAIDPEAKALQALLEQTFRSSSGQSARFGYDYCTWQTARICQM